MGVVRHLTITGRVQGVGYRAWVADEAKARGLSGWVRNRLDGSVEVVIAGSETAVEAMLASCRRGPPSARVAAIVANNATEDEFKLRGTETFAMLPTV